MSISSALSFLAVFDYGLKSCQNAPMKMLGVEGQRILSRAKPRIVRIAVASPLSATIDMRGVDDLVDRHALPSLAAAGYIEFFRNNVVLGNS